MSSAEFYAVVFINPMRTVVVHGKTVEYLNDRYIANHFHYLVKPMLLTKSQFKAIITKCAKEVNEYRKTSIMAENNKIRDECKAYNDNLKKEIIEYNKANPTNKRLFSKEKQTPVLIKDNINYMHYYPGSKFFGFSPNHYVNINDMYKIIIRNFTLE